MQVTLNLPDDISAALKEHGVALQYTEADVESDLEAHREIGLLRQR